MIVKYFSVFSGEVYDLDEQYTDYLDCGQLKITDQSKKQLANGVTWQRIYR